MPSFPRVSSQAVLASCLLALGLFGAAGEPARAQEGASVLDLQSIELQLAIDRRLLSTDVADYRDARNREIGARLHADEVAVRLDDQLVESSAVPMRAARDAATARADLDRAESQVSSALSALTERLRRIALLERLRAQSLGLPEVAKPEEGLAGRWQITLDSGGPVGILELKLSDQVVFGSLHTAEGETVAIRGGREGKDLKLDPVMIVGAPTRIFEGSLNLATGQLEGSWQASDPASGQPLGAGTWTAIRLRGPATEMIQQEDIE